MQRPCFDGYDDAGVIAFWPLGGYQTDRPSGFKRSVTIHLNGGIMGENSPPLRLQGR